MAQKEYDIVGPTVRIVLDVGEELVAEAITAVPPLVGGVGDVPNDVGPAVGAADS